jgi:hypothetical protein
MIEQAEQPKTGAIRKPRRLRWVFLGLFPLLYIALVVSRYGVLFWIRDTTPPSEAREITPPAEVRDAALSPPVLQVGPHGTIPSFRCEYFTGTRTFRLDTSRGFGAEPCYVLRRAPASPPVSVVDARAVLPDGALPKERYIRRYSLREVLIGDDTPYFTTQGEFGFVAPRRVWVAVYTLPGHLDEKHRPGLIVMSEEEAMPMAVHGGCMVVNLVADPDDGQTFASWCNVDDRPTADGSPRAVPTFIRR